jgi:hypothetical protein
VNRFVADCTAKGHELGVCDCGQPRCLTEDVCCAETVSVSD